jgi:hypothetical protein
VRKIELLARSHDRNGFDCGNEPLNSFDNELELFLPADAIQKALAGNE